MTLEGRTLGEFQVLRRLGEGGFGVVYAARQQSLARDAVIKVMAASAAVRAVDVERFLREARVAAAIDHPYAAHIYAFGAEPDGLRWIAMERVDGTPLDQVLGAQGPMPIARFVPFFERVCEVVHHAHERGVVHRDLKPANVMVLARSGRLLPKLLDFGIAGLHGEPVAAGPVALDDGAVAALTQAGPLGSPHYMAPEQWQAPHQVGPAADLYALGVLAYETLSGRRPFVGQTLREIARAHARARPAPLGLAGGAAIDEVLARTWRRDPAERWPNALELGQALRAAAGLAEAAPAPRLPAELRAEVLVTAPTPIADAVAALDTAADPAAAAAAVAVIARALLRYLVLVAAAGARALRPSEDVVGQLWAVERRSDAAWLALGRDLIGGCAARPETFPIPEVVVAFGDDAAATATHLAAALVGEDRPLAAVVAAVARALETARGVFAYRLVVAGAGGTEAWTGVRRDRRAPLAVVGLEAGAVSLIDDDGAPRVALSPLVLARTPAVGVAEALFFVDGHDAGGARFVAWPTGHEHRDPSLGPVAAAVGVAAVETPPFVGLSSFTAADADRFFGREPQIEAVLNRLRVHPLVAVVGPSGVGKTSFVQAGVVPRLPTGWRSITVRPGAAPLDELAARLAELGGGARTELRRALGGDPNALRRALHAVAGPGVIVLVVEQLEELITLASDGDRRAAAVALAHAVVTIDDPVRVIVTLRDDFLVRAQELGALWTRCVAGLELLGPPAPDELIRVLTAPLARVGHRFDDPALAAEMVASVAGQPGALPLLQFAAARLWEHRDVAARQLTRAAYERLGGVGGALAGHADAIVARHGVDERRQIRAVFRQLVTAEGTRAVVARADLERHLGGRTAILEELIDARLLVARDSAEGEVQIEVVHEALLTAWPQLVAWRRDDAEGLWLRDQLRTAARQWSQRGRPEGLLWRGDALADLARWRARHPDALGAHEDAFATASAALEARQVRRRRIAYVGALVILALAATAFSLIARDARRARVGADAAREAAELSRRAAEDRTTQLYFDHGRRALLADDGQRAFAYLREARQRGARGPAIDTLLGRAARLVLAERASAQAADRVQVVAWRPDGQVFATGTDDGTVEIWSAAGERSAVLRGHTGAVWNLTWTPDGARLLSSGADNLPRLWEPATGRLIAELRGHVIDGKGRGGITSTAVSPDGRWFASASRGGDAWLWPATAGTPGARLAAPGTSVLEVAFSRDSAVVVATDREATRIWDVAAARLRARIAEPTGAVRCAGFSASGLLAVTASAGPVRIIEPRAGVVTRTATVHEGLRCPVVIDDLLITVGAGGELRAWGLDGARRWESATGLDVTSLAAARDRVVAGTESGWVRILDRESGRPVVALSGFRQKIWAVAVASDGQAAVAAALDGTIRVFTTHGVDELSRRPARPLVVGFDRGGQSYVIEDRRRLAAGPEITILHAARAADGRILTLDEGGAVRWWSAAGDELVGPQVSGAVLVAITADGRRAAIGHDDNTISLWDVDGWKRGAVLRGHSDLLESLTFDPAGGRLATASDDRTVRVWSVADGAPIATLVGHTNRVLAARFTPDGGILTGGSDRTVRRWDLPTGRQRSSVDHDGEVFAVAAAADGARIAAGGAGGVYVWSTDGALLARPLVSPLVSSIDWNREGSQLVAAASDDARNAERGSVVTLDLAPFDAGREGEVACRMRFAVAADGRLEDRISAPCPR